MLANKTITPILLLVFVLLFSGLFYKENFVAQQCGAISSCKDCAGTSGCAWCLNKQQCVETDRFGVPAGRECSDTDIASFPSNCARVPSNTDATQTISVPDGTGSNVAGGSATAPPWLQNAFGTGNVNTNTYDTGAFTQAYYQQFYNNPTGKPFLPPPVSGSAGLASPSQLRSSLENTVASRYQNVCPDYTKVESSIKNNLGSNVKMILKNELQRNGLRYIEGFDTLLTTQKAVQASINDDITKKVREAIAKKGT